MSSVQWATPELQRWADKMKHLCLDALTTRLTQAGFTPDERLYSLAAIIRDFPGSSEGLGEQVSLQHTACFALASALVHEDWVEWHRMLQIACGFDPEETMSIRLQEEFPEATQALQNELRAFHQRWH